MIQIFIKQSKITKADWQNAYNRIDTLTKRFPLLLERIESYNGFEKGLDKTHYDLKVNAGKNDEHISFWGDKMSYTAALTVRFYKNLQKVIVSSYESTEINEDKPVTWHKPAIYQNYGLPIRANGLEIVSCDASATYRYAIIAIGIMLENTLPGRAFMIEED